MEEPRIEYVALDELQRWPRNPKDHDIGTLSGSLSRFGYVMPALIDERTGKLAAGHGRLDTLQQRKALGGDAPARIRVEGDKWLMPVIRGISFNSDEELEAYLVADNRTSELGGWDDVKLAQILSDLAAGPGLDGTGYDEDDTDRLLTYLKPFDPDSVEFPEYDESVADTVEYHECPECSYRWPK